MRRAGSTLVTAALVVAALAAVSPAGAEVAGPATSAYVAVGPVRLADTRQPDCGCNRLTGDTVRVDVAGHTDVPDTAVAAAITVTALPTAAPAFVTAYPGGAPRPHTSTVNTATQRVVANSAIVPLGADGTLDVFAKLPGDVIVDVTGVFVPADAARAGRFVPVDPQRLVDTRASDSPLGPGGELTVARPASVPDDATALALNVTSVGDAQAGHLSARPAGAALGAPTSFVNLDGSGRPVAAAVVLPTSPDGVTIASHGGGHVIVDVVGWFTGESAEQSAEGLFVPEPPRRLLDTRTTAPRVYAGGTVEIPGVAGAAALVTNVTATAADWRGYVTAYPAGTPRPGTSTVNPAYHDHTVANLAITRASDRGLAYYSLGGTDLVVDLTGYFTGAPVGSPEPLPPNDLVPPRVLVIGDSAMAAVDDVYTDSKAVLAWADVYWDADACRRLVHPSCLSNTTDRVPNTALQAIDAAPGAFDVVYIDAGHNDWYDDDLAWQFAVIVDAARAKGAKVILWSTYTEQPAIRPAARDAYAWNNQYLRQLVSLPAYPDVLLADWNAHSWNHPGWFWDGTHLYREGAWALASFISDQVGAVYHLGACPQYVFTGQVCPLTGE